MPKGDYTERCLKCSLCKSRKNVVFGRGSFKASIIICGEAPGADEDSSGRPFVGRSGSILDKMLEASNLSRKNVFITNVCMCRPPNNRKPRPSEIKACFPRLKNTLGQLAGGVVLVGSTASRAVLGKAFYHWGQPIWSKRINKWAVPIKHPGWYLHGNMNYLPFGINEFVDIVKQFRKLRKLGRL